MPSTTLDLKTIQLMHRKQDLRSRVHSFYEITSHETHTYFREVVSSMDKEVLVIDHLTGVAKYMLMFASNNYLGLANHPYVKEKVKCSIDKFGCGVGGPPLLNGYNTLIREAEERIAAWKKQEDAVIFSSGFATNLGILGALTRSGDLILFDELSHASFYDGVRYSNAHALPFEHNNMEALDEHLTAHRPKPGSTVFVGAEGIYSMDGDKAPLDELSRLCKKHNAISIIDDAHGSGVLGKNGSGTTDFFHCTENIDIHMGTFSKAFAVSGGFVAGSREMMNYLRYYSRPYFFSASIPPSTAAAVIACLDVMENEPWLQTRLLENVAYAVSKLKRFGLYAPAEGGFLTLNVPPQMNVRKAASMFHEKGIFLNAIEYPAVEANKQRFRISFMSTHIKDDIDLLADTVEEIWNSPQAYTFLMIWYSHINEDSRIERDLLFSGNYKTVACISGSGERLIALLDYPARDFYAIDINPDALKLLELKLKALEHLGIKEYLEFTGNTVVSSLDRVKMFSDISGSLSSECREYWNSRIKSISKGIVNAGHFERYLSGLRPMVKLFLGKSFNNVFQNEGPKKDEFPVLRWKILNHLFCQRWVLSITGNRDQSFIGEMADSKKIGRGLNTILERGEANDAYVFHLIFKGSLTSMPHRSLPASLQPSILSVIRERIKSRDVKIHYAEGDYYDAAKEFGLCKQENVFHSLSDIIGFENEEYMRNLLSEILAGQGNMAVARSFLVNHIRPEMLEQAGFKSNNWKDYSSMESTHMYQVIAINS